MATIILGLELCILCEQAPPESWEHIIPQSLGGRLKADLLCGRCNNETGARLVAQLVGDPSVTLAVENLKVTLPRLHSAFSKNVTYVAPGPDGAPIQIRSGKLRTRRGKDGSLLIASALAHNHLEKQLRAMGVGDDQIKAELARFSQLPDGELQVLAPGLEVRRFAVDSLQPRLTGQLVEDRWPTLAALEFLTLNLKAPVLSAYFEPVREFIFGDVPPSTLSVERLTTGRYAPFHGLRWLRGDNEIRCYVHLFGWLVFRVTFSRVRMEGPLAAYVEQLDTGKSLLAPDGESDMYQILNP